MPRQKIYGEAKRKTTLTLTETAFRWLESIRSDLKATSISDAIERMARDSNFEVPTQKDNT